MPAEPLTLFTFGYEGWGSTTKQLIEAVDAVEASRGFRPPLFVDIRLSRSVRAPEFTGDAFAKQLGADRYIWLDSLGNANVKQGGFIRIKDPAVATTLLEIAETNARNKRRVLFFCHCPTPGDCHRSVVADLILDVARQRNLPIEIVEWPGGKPRLHDFEITVSAANFDKIFNGAKTIPLEEPFSLVEMASVPWLSLVNVRDKQGGDVIGPFGTGPAVYVLKSKAKPGRWCLKRLFYMDRPIDEAPGLIQQARQQQGYEPRRSLDEMHTGTD